MSFGTPSTRNILSPADNTAIRKGRLGRPPNQPYRPPPALAAAAGAEAHRLGNSDTECRIRQYRTILPDNPRHHNMYLLWHNIYRRKHFVHLDNSPDAHWDQNCPRMLPRCRSTRNPGRRGSEPRKFWDNTSSLRIQPSKSDSR